MIILIQNNDLAEKDVTNRSAIKSGEPYAK